MAEVDTSIYRMQQPVGEGPAMADQFMSSYGAGQNLKTVALKNKQLDTENQMAQMNAHLQKAQTFGNALEGLSKLPEDQRAQQYGAVRNEMLKNGIISPDQAPEQYDPNFYQSTLTRYRQTAPAIQNQLQQANVGHVNAETAKLQSETIKRNPGAGDFSDPAKMVAQYIPKEHQAQAFKEIDAAENTKKMSSSIMDSFDQAAKDTAGVGGAIGSVFKTPRSALALHQAMQPTFKDLEGTVRQAAMDNTFKNITPGPGDTQADIAKKRAALASYLESKSSSPIARAYGIDLSKFQSTQALNKPAPEQSGRLTDFTMAPKGGVFNSAQAAEPAKSAVKPGTVEQGFVFMGGDPSDQKNWKKR